LFHLAHRLIDFARDLILVHVFLLNGC
jgi:hypothetical protein